MSNFLLFLLFLALFQSYGSKIPLTRIETKLGDPVYLGVISVGQQNFNVEINLQSSVLWVPECLKGTITRLNRMGRRRALDDVERAEIQTHHQYGRSNRWIANKIGRSEKAVRSFLKDPLGYGTKKAPGRPPILSGRDKRRILAKVSNSMRTCSALKKDLGLKVSTETIRRVIHASGIITRCKMIPAPALKPVHKRKRLEFARLNMSTNFRNVIWSDEKKWNLEGPDGWSHYWHDLRKEPRYFNKRNFGGGSLMCWAAFSSHGKVQIAFPSMRMTSEEYQAMLDACLLPYLEEHSEVPFVMQQDNATIHNSGSTKQWFEAAQLPVIDWPPRSPDLNVIENVWSLLVSRVYENGRQFDSVQALKTEIVKAWEGLSLEVLNNYVVRFQSVCPK